MEIKICGITKPIEADYLNEANVDYAGFVFFEKSKRNVTLPQAQEIFAKLNAHIKKVAVMVSPDVEMVETLQKGGFDILQIHKELTEDVLAAAELPVWYAINIEDDAEAARKQAFIDLLPEELRKKIKAIVVDAKDFGSGKTFNWHKSKRLMQAGCQSPPERKFILAGGLRPENVREGIEIFSPDIVDVSSGVEGENGKDREKIMAFVEAARQ